MKVISESTTIEEVAALVSESLSRAGITAVLSGGGAVQIYSNGLYVSRDLDFVSPAPVKEIARAVRALGFEPASGRHFVRPTCPFTLVSSEDGGRNALRFNGVFSGYPMERRCRERLRPESHVAR